MQWTWRMVGMYLRVPLRGALSRWWVWKRLCLAGIFCSLCVFLYYQQVSSSYESTLIVPAHSDSNIYSLVSVSRSYTEISKQYDIITSEERRMNQNVRRTPVVAEIPSHPSTQETVRLETSKTKNHTLRVDSEHKEVKGTAKSPEKSKSYQYEKVRLPRVLLLYGAFGYRPSLEARAILESQRIPYHFSSIPKARNLISLKTNLSLSHEHPLRNLSLVILVSFYSSSSVSAYFEFCRLNNLSLIWAILPEPVSTGPQTESKSQSPKRPHTSLRTTTISSDAIGGLTLSPSFPFYFGQPGASSEERFSLHPRKNWTIFSLRESGDSHMTGVQSFLNDTQAKKSLPIPDHQLKWNYDNKNYRTLVEVSMKYDSRVNGGVGYSNTPVVVEDKGSEDGVRKLVIGTNLRFWASQLVLMEGIRLYCEGLMRQGRERMVMVDIDDVFLAPEGRKMTHSDVQALLKTQREIRELVPGFTFNAGFVGFYYDHGQESEILGNQELVRNADQLWWFGHMFKHKQPHLMTPEELITSMKLNMQFSKEHGIQASDHHYSVSPHHSGVYPVYPPLYKAWREVWNISVTTTEEYPDLRPEYKRRGFKHNGISVLPRQTCRLFTHTYLYSHFPRGKQDILSFARGGEVFLSVLRNPIAIFMTHTPNYCCDRLALTLFPALFEFISYWTQLELSTPGPQTMADRYFSLYPEDAMPLWTSPCDFKRHREIWPTWMNCSRLPSLLVLGPQKSGTTALHTFLQLHPQVLTNRPTELHYEEVQFFSDDTLYERGIDWYMDQFPYPPLPPHINSSLSPAPHPPPTSSSSVIFEKSATYFSHPLAPKRVHSLIPRAMLLVILADPSRRAYSWYQHQRAHSDPIALQYTFSQVLNASTPSSSAPPLLSSLSNHCLSPGHYYTHLTRWLQFFDPTQLLLVDGDELIEDPADVMDTVIQYMDLPPYPYQDILQYDHRKRFFCILKGNGKKKCLGKSKGRSYPPMSEEDREWLAKHYAPHNLQLKRLLNKLGRPYPDWLIELPPLFH